jgi:GTP-binding protein EngB required for normal cell division
MNDSGLAWRLLRLAVLNLALHALVRTEGPFGRHEPYCSYLKVTLEPIHRGLPVARLLYESRQRHRIVLTWSKYGILFRKRHDKAPKRDTPMSQGQADMIRVSLLRSAYIVYVLHSSHNHLIQQQNKPFHSRRTTIIRMTQSLLDTDHAQVFDLIETLGHQIKDIVELPQIVVCGDQSAGKSSLLQAISGIKLPAANRKCTLFPTRLVLQRSTEEYIIVTIQPSMSCSDNVRSDLNSFRDRLAPTDDLTHVVEAAKAKMGLQDSVTDHILNIEIFGQQCPHLTLVDLPGLISYDTDSNKQVALIDSMVREYVSKDRTIILAVLSAATDFELQKVLSIIKEYDPHGKRTLGIITKPDKLAGPSREPITVSWAKNKHHALDLGWHIVKNADNDVHHDQIKVSRIDETTFFNGFPWSTIAEERRGFRALINRLSKHLGLRLSEDIPKIAAEIETQLDDCNSELHILGNARETEEAQREHLTVIADKFRDLVRDGLEGRYYDKLFETEDLRLCSLINDVQYSLLYHILCYGPTAEISCVHSEFGFDKKASTIFEKRLKEKFGHLPLMSRKLEQMTCGQHAQRVENDIVTRNRSSYQPGLTDPALMGTVFKDMTQHWDPIVRQHLNNAHNLVVNFVYQAFRLIADESIRISLDQEILVAGLSRMRDNLSQKATEILAPYRDGQPKSWHPEVISNMVGANDFEFRKTDDTVDPMQIADFTASERLCHQAYVLYDRSRFTMIDTIGALAIERCLLHELKGLFTSRDVSKMDAATLERLAGEPPAHRERRRSTRDKKDRLEKALMLCHHYQRRLQQCMSTQTARRRDIPSNSVDHPIRDEGATLATLAAGMAAMSMNEQSLLSSTAAQKSAPSTPPQKPIEAAEVHHTPVPPLTPTHSQSPSPVKPETPKDANMFTPTAAWKTKPSQSKSPRVRAREVAEESEEEEL